jgi:hypothetical protein
VSPKPKPVSGPFDPSPPLVASAPPSWLKPLFPPPHEATQAMPTPSTPTTKESRRIGFSSDAKISTQLEGQQPSGFMFPHILKAPQLVAPASPGHVTLQLSTLVQSTAQLPVHVTLHDPELLQLICELSPALTVHVFALSQL